MPFRPALASSALGGEWDGTTSSCTPVSTFVSLWPCIAISAPIFQSFAFNSSEEEDVPAALPVAILSLGFCPSGLSAERRRCGSVWALGRPIDKKRGSPTYVNVINIHRPGRTPGNCTLENREGVMPIVARLDELGRPAWILLMILGFMMWWPVGFTVLAFIIGSGRMSCGYLQDKMERLGRGGWWGYHGSNRAFDEYPTETLKRMEDEQREFRDFVARLRQAKDKAEFDQFMAERRNRPPEQASQQG